MATIPFLRPNLVKKGDYLHFLSRIEDSRLFSNYGPLNSLFEDRVIKEVFNHTGAAVTVNNATSGLMLAISQCKRPNARYALMPNFTFAATPLAAMWCGLEPYFVDISQDDWCMNEYLLNELIEKLGEQVAVVVPYATFGTHMDLNYYQKLQDAGIPVVVDAAASFGTTMNDGHFGKGFSGSMVFSFHATKVFGIGEGGLVYSGNKQNIDQIRQAGNFGFSDSRESVYSGDEQQNIRIYGSYRVGDFGRLSRKKRRSGKKYTTGICSILLNSNYSKKDGFFIKIGETFRTNFSLSCVRKDNVIGIWLNGLLPIKSNQELTSLLPAINRNYFLAFPPHRYV